jgi:hypothetical protein
MSSPDGEVGLDTPYAIRVKSQLYGLEIAFAVLATVALSARLYVRISGRIFGLEDWLLIFAMVCPALLPAQPLIVADHGLCQDRTCCHQ